MKKMLIAFLCVLMLAGCTKEPDIATCQFDVILNDYEIDPVATENAPWEIKEVVADVPGVSSEDYWVERIFLGVTVDGYYIAQDRYDGHSTNPQIISISKPYLVTDENGLISDELLLYHGHYELTHASGVTFMECDFDHGTTTEPCIMRDEKGRIVFEISYVNGIRHGSYKSWEYYVIDNPDPAYTYQGPFFTEGQYCNGSPYCGYWRLWDGNGNLIKEKFETPI